MFPVRCYTCNSVLAHLHPQYERRCEAAEEVRQILDDLGVRMMCCRRMFISHVGSLVESQLHYPNDNRVMDSGGTTLLRRCTQEHDVDCD